MRYLSIILLVASVVSADESNDTTGKVYFHLTDFALAMHEHHQSPYVVVASGKKLSLSPTSGFREFRIWWITARNKKNKYVAHGYEFESGGRLVEQWLQQMTTPDGTRFRDSNPFGKNIDPTKDKDYDERRFQKRMRLNPLYPMEASIMPALMLRDGFSKTRANCHNFYLKLDLRLGKRDENSNVVSEWGTKHKVPSGAKFTVVFGKDSKWYPIEQTTSSAFRGDRITIAASKTKWKDFGGRYLPNRIEARLVSANGSKAETSYELDLDWILDNEVTDKLFDLETTDWREPYRDLFNAGWRFRNTPAPIVTRSEQP